MKRYLEFLSLGVVVAMLSFMTALAGEPQLPLRKDATQTATFVVTTAWAHPHRHTTVASCDRWRGAYSSGNCEAPAEKLG